MTLKELEVINNVDKIDELISAKDLLNTKDRTLLYGYTCARETFHVYLKNNEIHTVMYNNDYSGDYTKPKNMRELAIKSNYGYVPDKRLYPEACDYEFCRLLKENGIYLPFTNFNENRPEQDFYGYTIEDIEHDLEDIKHDPEYL